MSKIQWTDATWNPTRGCTRVSPGCENCYAERQAIRMAGFERSRELEAPYKGLVERSPKGPRWTGKIRLVPEKLEEPLRRRKPTRWFVDSMSDLFHEQIPDSYIAKVFGVMAFAAKHTFQILTKRQERMRNFVSQNQDAIYSEYELRWKAIGGAEHHAARAWSWPLPNVWLGVSVEDQKRFAERWPELAKTPAAVRFLSVEPLLEALEFHECCSLCGGWSVQGKRLQCERCGALWSGVRPDWIIVGGESGPGARPCNVEWIRSIVRQCREAGVPCFVKQLGAVVIDRNDAGFMGEEPTDWPDMTEYDESWTPHRMEYQGAPWHIKLRARKGDDPREWPKDLRVREWPA